MHVLLLGANGLLGSNSLGRLLRSGIRVTASCYSGERAMAVRETGIEGDFLRPETLDSSKDKFDWMIHMASATTPHTLFGD